MEVRRYLNIIRRRLLLILVIVFAGVAAGFLITPRVDTYTATSTLYVGSRSINLDPTSGQVSGDRTAGLDRLISTFLAMLDNDAVAEGAVEDVEVDRTVDEVRAATSATQQTGTNLIEVAVTDEDPSVARTLSNAVTQEFVRLIRQFEPSDSEVVSSSSQDIVSVLSEADEPTAPNGKLTFRNMALGGILGLLVAGVVVALLEHLDITLRSTEDVERRLELPVLGVVPALGSQLPVVPASGVRRSLTRGEKGVPVG